MLKRLPRLLSALFAAAIVAGIVSVASPAQAAYPTCDVSGTVYNVEGILTSIPKNQAAGTTSCNLRRGDHSNAVRILQWSLNFCYGAAGGFNLALDSDFGPATEAALKWVQGHPGPGYTPVTVDGIYGPETRDGIKWRPQDNVFVGCVPV